MYCIRRWYVLWRKIKQGLGILGGRYNFNEKVKDGKVERWLTSPEGTEDFCIFVKAYRIPSARLGRSE